MYSELHTWQIIAGFFLLLAVGVALCSVYWHTKYEDLRELVERAYMNKILVWKEK